MKSKNMWILLGMVLLAGTILMMSQWLFKPSLQGDTPFLRITWEGEVLETIPLNEEREIFLCGTEEKENVVEVFLGGFRMQSSTCENQDCISQGDVTVENVGHRLLLNQVVCLPNEVVLALTIENSTYITLSLSSIRCEQT